MRLLYLTFQEDALLYVGVVRKIKWQAEAFRKLGYEVTYSLWNDLDYRFVTGGEAESYAVAPGSGLMHRFSQTAEAYLASHSFDVLYIRLDRVSADTVAICKTARARGVGTIIIEFPNYPYLRDYVHSADGVRSVSRRIFTRAKVLAAAAADRLAAPRLKGLVDAVALIGNPAGSYFGIRAVNISNGVDVDALQPVPPKTNEEEIVLAGVAGTLWWQAYDRVLEGMHTYKQAHPQGPRIRFILVGGDAKEMPGFLALVHRLGLDGDVECPGFKTGAELDAVYARADLGVSTLGCYRRGLQSCSSLKTREYCARGLPFLHTCEDSIKNEKVDFALRIPNDPSPVDMEAVVRFVRDCRKNGGLAREEREFARKHYDWKNIMKQVLVFAGAAVSDKN